MRTCFIFTDRKSLFRDWRPACRQAGRIAANPLDHGSNTFPTPPLFFSPVLTEVHAPQKIIVEYQAVDKRTNPFLTLQIDYTEEDLF